MLLWTLLLQAESGIPGRNLHSFECLPFVSKNKGKETAYGLSTLSPDIGLLLIEAEQVGHETVCNEAAGSAYPGNEFLNNADSSNNANEESENCTGSPKYPESTIDDLGSSDGVRDASRNDRQIFESPHRSASTSNVSEIRAGNQNDLNIAVDDLGISDGACDASRDDCQIFESPHRNKSASDVSEIHAGNQNDLSVVVDDLGSSDGVCDAYESGIDDLRTEGGDSEETESEPNSNSTEKESTQCFTGKNLSSLTESQAFQLLLSDTTGACSQWDLTMFMFCMQNKVTHKMYKDLVKLQMPNSASSADTFSMSKNSRSPESLGTLINRVFHRVQAFVKIKTADIQIFTATGSYIHCTPYLSFKTACLIWMTSPFVSQSISETNEKFILPYIELEQNNHLLLNRIKKLRTYAETYGVNTRETATEFLALIERTSSSWKPAYAANARLPANQRKKALFIHIALWNDDFGWMGTVSETKGQTLIIASAGSRGLRSSPLSLANLPLMLTASAGIKKGGLNKVLDIYSNELHNIAKGLEVSIDGQEFLLFPFISTVAGDSPARFRALGLSTSVINSVPCGQCLTPKKDFARSAFNPTLLKRCRTGFDVQAYLIPNNFETGNFEGANKLVARSKDMIIYQSQQHGQHFNLLITFSKSKSLYQDLSRLFRDYCKQNGISAAYDFKDANSMKGLNAYGLKQFLLVSPWLLLNLGAIPDNHDELRSEFLVYCHRWSHNISDSVLITPPGLPITDLENDSELHTGILYTSATGSVVLNWAGLKRRDYMLVDIHGDVEGKKMEGSLQWLRCSNDVQHELLMVTAEDCFIRRIKTLDFDDESVLIVDDANELFSLLD
ncbi:hypothetical protein HDU81_008289 [Chytriomyces hyalinus]|nr:hypothetical protein HDU81_008289 [Chytriomyces hyalinus]